MVFECACGEGYPVADDAAPESIRCHRCGRILVRAPRHLPPPAESREFLGHAGTLPYAGLAALAIAVLAGLMNMAAGAAGDSADRRGVAMRVETVPGGVADAAEGRGVLKVINDSGKTIAFRLMGPAYSDSRTILVPAWQDAIVFGLSPGTWMAKYCTGSEWRPDERRFAIPTACAELDRTIPYTETIVDEILRYGAAVVRFGPSPGESPPAHQIAAEDFAAD
ncbi:MAG: hypothetical protein ABSH47_18825 [Bryobacteraceae bacterium]|jgi:hypothetical protein